jgi:urate oxidase
MDIQRIGEAERMTALSQNKYGKSLIRLARVKRSPERNEFHEWTLNVLLQGNFETCFMEGDNSKILPTDTMKNTVYSLARSSSGECMEEFAKELIDFLLRRNPQVSQAEVSISEKTWEHLQVGNRKPHPTTFMQSSGECQTAKVARPQTGKFSVVSGLENLVLMKTAGSAFEGYMQDSLTTLPESADRLLGTAVRANWTYTRADLGFGALRTAIRAILLDTFAEHASKSVQHTLYAMGEAVLRTVAEVEDIELIMPNRHYLPVDLSKFGQDNPNEIFVPIDEPHGYIEALVRRHG